MSGFWGLNGVRIRIILFADFGQFHIIRNIKLLLDIDCYSCNGSVTAHISKTAVGHILSVISTADLSESTLFSRRVCHTSFFLVLDSVGEHSVREEQNRVDVDFGKDDDDSFVISSIFESKEKRQFDDLKDRSEKIRFQSPHRPSTDDIIRALEIADISSQTVDESTAEETIDHGASTELSNRRWNHLWDPLRRREGHRNISVVSGAAERGDGYDHCYREGYVYPSHVGSHTRLETQNPSTIDQMGH